MALPATKPIPDDALQRLQSGELTLDEYLDIRVEKALAHVKGRMSEERYQMLRDVMREHIRTDPVCAEMARRVTGQTPVPFSEAPSC